MVEETSLEVLIMKDLVEVNRTWNIFIPGSTVLTYFDRVHQRVIISLIRIPVPHRRQGYCGEILDEVIVIARAYSMEVWLQPSEDFGTDKNVLVDMYKSYGFSAVNESWMKIK